MINWRDVPSEREHDKQIADRLGWEIRQWADGGWCLYDPHGRRFGPYVHIEDALEYLPMWSSDTDAALTLLEPEIVDPDSFKFSLVVERVEDLDFVDPKWAAVRGKLWYSASFYTGEGDEKETIAFGEAAVPAAAICKMWIAWKTGTIKS